jgi:DNA polymerase-3 subunit gamma/tau
MSDFVVSARKYRPVTFDTVVGQQHITTTLKHAIVSGHLAQAFLFCGPRGVGKTTCARILARTINCEAVSPEGEACGVCHSCTSFQNQNSFNFHELDAASNNSVDDIRNLTEQVRIPPQYGKYKVYIIDEVHMLTTQAFNAFLKTLEEPPPYAVFILATTEKHKIIPTILSRCQIFDFNRIRNHDIAAQLQKVADSEGISYESEALLQIARKADGGMRDALSMFDMICTFSGDRRIGVQAVLENLHILDSDYYFRVTDHIMEGRSTPLLLLLDEILRLGFDGHHFLLGLGEHMRNLILAGDPNTHSLLEQSPETTEKLKMQSSRSGHHFFLNLLSLVNQTELQYRSSKNPRLLTELCLMKMASLMAVLKSRQEEKKKALKTESFRSAEPSIEEVKPVPVLAFKKTPSLKQSAAPVQPSSASTNSEVGIPLRKEPLDLRNAKEKYLAWFADQTIGPVSAWTLAMKEERTEKGFRLTFKSGSIAEDNFSDEMKTIRQFFAERYESCPDFELVSSEEEQGSLSPYTNLEKFSFMAKKNPELEKLRTILGLDFSA